MESKVRVEGCKEDCPVTMEFEYKKTIKTRMEVEIRGRKLIVRIRDDQSSMKEIEYVIESIIRQMGEYIEIAKSEKYQVLD